MKLTGWSSRLQEITKHLRWIFAIFTYRITTCKRLDLGTLGLTDHVKASLDTDNRAFATFLICLWVLIKERYDGHPYLKVVQTPTLNENIALVTDIQHAIHKKSHMREVWQDTSLLSNEFQVINFNINSFIVSQTRSGYPDLKLLFWTRQKALATLMTKLRVTTSWPSCKARNTLPSYSSLLCSSSSRASSRGSRYTWWCILLQKERAKCEGINYVYIDKQFLTCPSNSCSSKSMKVGIQLITK